MGGDLQTLKRLAQRRFPGAGGKGFRTRQPEKERAGWDISTWSSGTTTQTGVLHHPGFLPAQPPTRWRDQGFATFPVSMLPYDDMLKNWRAFNYVFLVVYPPDKENDVLNALGPLADENDQPTGLRTNAP